MQILQNVQVNGNKLYQDNHETQLESKLPNRNFTQDNCTQDNCTQDNCTEDNFVFKNSIYQNPKY